MLARMFQNKLRQMLVACSHLVLGAMHCCIVSMCPPQITNGMGMLRLY
jgi:hypothetical protein